MNLRLELQILTKEAKEKQENKSFVNIYSIRHEMDKKAKLIIDLIPQIARNAARNGLNSVKLWMLHTMNIVTFINR